MRPVYHFTAHCLWARLPLADHHQARWLWKRLHAAFPDAIAVVLMPNHVHILLATDDPAGVLRRLRCILGAFARHIGEARLWTGLPEAGLLRTPDKIARQVRYVHLNPCRPFKHAGKFHRLTDDPLLWPWSTWRDLLGAARDPWISPARLAPWIDGTVTRHVQWTLDDKYVNPAARRLPVPAPRREVPARSLEDICLAAAWAVRDAPDAIRRRGSARSLFLALATHQGWTDHGALAAACGATRDAVRIAVRRPVALSAAALCLGDARLTTSIRFSPV